MEYTKLVPNDAEKSLIFYVNGQKVVEGNPDPEWTLLWYLRKRLHLTGTKYGCGEGGCGACTVMLSRYIKQDDRIKHYAVNACLTPVCSVHGLAVTTVEGIGSTQTKLHPIQERIAESHGSQCGFCTPGIIMSMYALIRNDNNIKFNDIDSALQGNLCRCTGYRPIIEGLKTFMEDWETVYGMGTTNKICALGKDCCRNKKDKNTLPQVKSQFQPYDPTQEPIFPPDLKINSQLYEKYLFYQSNNVVWMRPSTFEELVLIKANIPQSKIVVGNTEIGVEVKFKKMIYPVLVSVDLIDEMRTFEVMNERLVIGASTTLSEVKRILKNEINKNQGKRSDIFKEIVDMLHWFAGSQIRNVASIAGNIVTASPISDLNPILMACSAKLNVYNPTTGRRNVVIDDLFFKNYRITEIKTDDIVLSLEIPHTKENQMFKAFKQARRRDDDIAIVTAAFNIKFVGKSNIVSEAMLCFGGMGPTTLSAKNTATFIKGLEWTQTMADAVMEKLSDEFKLDESVPGGMAAYRKSLCLSLFFKFHLIVLQKLRGLESEMNIQENIIPKSSQIYEIRGDTRIPTDTVGLPVVHVSANKQVTGEALYCDDVPAIEGELFMTLIFSSKAHAKIIDINAEKALAVPGVVSFFSAKDIEEQKNKTGALVCDEDVFSKFLVTSTSCIIGALVAENESIARKAKDLIKVTYEVLSPVIVSLEDAIAYKSFFPGCPKVMKKGDVGKAFNDAELSVEGSFRSGAQEHFYLETNCVIAIRKEDELEIIASTQSPAETSHFISRVLGIPQHKVITKVKRLGGGFGGKETRTAIFAIPVALAAYKLKKPVRLVLDRDEDMLGTGYRHPYLIKYKVAFNQGGKIFGAIFDLYGNAGYSQDLSFPVNDRASAHVDNSYFIPNIEINGYVCKTNLPSNTAFRGFGAPQAMLATETMIRDVANAVNKSYEEVVAINMYNEGDLTHYGQCLTHCTLNRCWNECIELSQYWKRKTDIDQFNRINRWRKKGLSLVPTKYGVSFAIDVLMQGGALVLIYNDGSVLLSIGGIEMGQGLFTKMIQVASRVLEIDMKKIHLNESSTDKVPNSSPTAASVSSDLYGMAVMDACSKLMKRLKPYKNKNLNGKWEDWVNEAYCDRVNLAATGFYASPKMEYDPITNTGRMYEYYTYGVACSEVLIDCLTGDHEVVRTDIVMDIGESLNPAIDIGQIEGGFMQGYGLCTLEEMVFSARGELYSRGPGTYKIPGFSNIPKEFNVSLLKGAPNPRAVYSSKAVGEPPLFLAASVFFAIKEAIKSARLDANVDPNFKLDAPATCERIRMACEDHITNQVKPTIMKTGNPWNIVP